MQISTQSNYGYAGLHGSPTLGPLVRSAARLVLPTLEGHLEGHLAGHLEGSSWRCPIQKGRGAPAGSMPRHLIRYTGLRRFGPPPRRALPSQTLLRLPFDANISGRRRCRECTSRLAWLEAGWLEWSHPSGRGRSNTAVDAVAIPVLPRCLCGFAGGNAAWGGVASTTAAVMAIAGVKAEEVGGRDHEGGTSFVCRALAITSTSPPPPVLSAVEGLMAPPF